MQIHKIFLYSSLSCPGSFANSIKLFEGMDSYREGIMASESLDNSDAAWIENARFCFVKPSGAKFSENGFETAQEYFNWLDAAPCSLILDRPCKQDEEILCYYDWDETLKVPEVPLGHFLSTQSTETQMGAAEEKSEAAESALASMNAAEEKFEEEESAPALMDQNTSLQKPANERDRIEKCGECGQNTGGLHFCDWEGCKKKMHGHCGVGIGEERSTQVRRCSRHNKQPTMNAAVSAPGSQPQARLFGGKTPGPLPLPSSPADTAKERHQQKRQRLEKEKSTPKPQAPTVSLEMIDELIDETAQNYDSADDC